jgi:hypothetical protein
MPNISDFGISRLVGMQHTCTLLVDMDPVNLQTGLLTEKSDVYSIHAS